MRKTTFTITVPHLFSPISVFNAESKSYIIALRFNVHETFQINQFNSSIETLHFVQSDRICHSEEPFTRHFEERVKKGFHFLDSSEFIFSNVNYEFVGLLRQ